MRSVFVEERQVPLQGSEADSLKVDPSWAVWCREQVSVVGFTVKGALGVVERVNVGAVAVERGSQCRPLVGRKGDHQGVVSEHSTSTIQLLLEVRNCSRVPRKMLMEESEDPARLRRAHFALVMVESMPQGHEKCGALVDNRPDVLDRWCDRRASRGQRRRNGMFQRERLGAVRTGSDLRRRRRAGAAIRRCCSSPERGAASPWRTHAPAGYPIA